ncbi:hypothetical protein COT72_02810 [archaeon CG10_big_fil_rev_8_21_14_0_10_43_11]|nr:MAG: hypothetical protein COT72_02810 [archaeon CG10_big_fil_rev_8_21_14_0_10_43_11]
MPNKHGSRYYNRRFYEGHWKRAGRIFKPTTWPLHYAIKPFLHGRVLEIGPGVFPKSDVADTTFLEVTKSGKEMLESSGRHAVQASVLDMPFLPESFDTALAFEVIEHVSDDVLALSEVFRVLKKGGRFIISVPINMRFWSVLDKEVGHTFRYSFADIKQKVENAGFEIEKIGFNQAQSVRGATFLRNLLPRIMPSSYWVYVLAWVMRFIPKSLIPKIALHNAQSVTRVPENAFSVKMVCTKLLR